MSLMKSKALQLFLFSFLILFLELTCIRWISSYILYLGYFTNFVLLGCLLGIGAGALISKRQTKLILWAPLFILVFIILILFTRAQVDPQFKDYIYFTSNITSVQVPAYILLPVIFIGVTVIFTLLTQDMGALLNDFPPLTAYNINILGSLAGIGSFTVMSAIALPAWVWFCIAMGIMVLLLPPGRFFFTNLLIAIGVVVIVAASDYAYANIWSPYYRLDLLGVKGDEAQLVRPGSQLNQKDSFILLANGVGHQGFTSLGNSEPFYELPYTTFNQAPNYQEVLVVGAGGGNDVAFALMNGVKHIDAVEIDARIADLGKQYHPEKPYSDPRVTLYIDDARSFLQKTDKRYDLIIFALPDSLILAASSSNIRLESYLFTIESFQSVKDHLTSRGLFVLYNYYRYDWLVNKIGYMLTQVFDKQPVFHRYDTPLYNAVAFSTIFAGPKAEDLNTKLPGFYSVDLQPIQPATDNWPFLYLDSPHLPLFYSAILLIILVFSGGYIWRISPKGCFTLQSWPFFFMGAAFTLLEVKSIVQFLLLFGSTWLVNSLVFFGVLLIVLLANWLAAHRKFTKMWRLYSLLFISLVINYIVPLRMLLLENLIARYALAIMFLFSPIFFANLIYSTTFRETKQANIAFGANLLGTLVGGASEYLSLYLGYKQLVIFAGIFYCLAFIAFFFSVERKFKIRQKVIEY